MKTPAGLSESQAAGELCAQWSGGAALASQHDIDRGVKCYFENSTDEASYEGVKIQPQAYQDDLARVALSTASARTGNIKLSMMLRERLLSCHPTKTTYVLLGSETYKKEVRQEFLRSPLMFGNFRLNEKEQYMYLGDMIDTGG